MTLFIHFNHSEEESLKWFSYLFLLFCLKEALMLIGSFILLGMNIVPRAAEIYGKVATFVFYLVMGALLCFAPGMGAFAEWFELPDMAIVIMVSVSATLTVVAFLSYLPDTVRQIRNKKNAAKENAESENEEVQNAETGMQNKKIESEKVEIK